MSDAEAQNAVVAHWMRKADEAISAAYREHHAGDLALAINRIYYACFYAASAVLLAGGETFVKHSGVRSAVHQHLVKTGKIPGELGEFYDRAFDDRMEVDYQVTPSPEPGEVLSQIQEAEQFVATMKRILGKQT